MSDILERASLASLVGSRICHDLISPIGAINNGMELLAMSGIGNSPEMALISESVDAANARIRFFRIAYGATGDTQRLKPTEILAILRDMTRGTRTEIHWEPQEDVSRDEVQIAFLGIQCAEQAIPFGGRIALRRIGQTWEIMITADRYAMDEKLWQRLTGSNDTQGTLMPAHVQFMLLPEVVRRHGRTPSFTANETGIRLTL